MQGRRWRRRWRGREGQVHDCTLTMVGKLISTGYGLLSSLFSGSVLPKVMLVSWMETTSPNTVELLQRGKHLLTTYTLNHSVHTYLGKYFPIEPSAMVTTAIGSPTEDMEEYLTT